MKRDKFITTVVAGLVIGFFVTVSTIFYRTTTTQELATDGGCNGTWCNDALAQAGFPFPYLRDSLGVSVIGSLGIEDRFLLGAFLMDWLLFFFCVCLLFIIVWRMKERASR